MPADATDAAHQSNVQHVPRVTSTAVTFVGGMPDKLEAAVRAAVHAVGLIADRAAAVDPRALIAGALLYVVSQGIRTRGWHTILRAAYPREAANLRARDVMRAYLAGAGINSIVPARGGDVVKLAMVHRRIEGSRYSTLAATFLPEALFEAIVGVGLVAWALANGFLPVPTTSGELPTLDVTLVFRHPVLSALVVATVGLAGWWLVRRVGRQMRQALAILGTPMLFVTGVASWQALARVIRLGSLAAFMAAFHLPVTVSTVVLVMAAQGGGRILPLAPVSAGLRLAMLSYGFVEVTGRPVDIAAITTFTFGVSAVLCLTGLLLSFAILAQELGTMSPRRAVAAARRRVPSGTWTTSLPASSTTAPSTEASG
jgi:Lysylphosphatidylglycerol synthase TM region